MRAWIVRVTQNQAFIQIMRIVIFVALIFPVLKVTWQFATDDLGGVPAQEIILLTGDWSMRLLVAVLALRPIRDVFGWHWLHPYRRVIGLAAAFYAFAHFWAFADKWEFDLLYLWGEVTGRVFLAIGTIATVLLVPLAITSMDWMVKQLGGRNWRRLHSLVYTIAVLALVHFLLSTRIDPREAIYLTGFLGWLLTYRLLVWQRRRRRLYPALSGLTLAGIGVGWTVLTGGLEIAYFEFATGIGAGPILGAYSMLDLLSRPAAVVALGSALMVAGQALIGAQRRPARQKTA